MMPTTMSAGSYSVGSLSALNAVAGSASEDLPVVILAGGPGTSAKAEYRLLHRTLGTVDNDLSEWCGGYGCGRVSHECRLHVR
jgi:TPP-dependent 2-oxoacid decarboxylase